MERDIKLTLENYHQQLDLWPKEGRHILAQYDDEKVIVYQAYCASIGEFAAENNFFGGDFSYTRMSWIKTNFLWMMYRCGWASKDNQETVLAIHLKREFFDRLLAAAFPSSNILGLGRPEWNNKIAASDVRLQWDPDHDPLGHKQARRAIQLGLRKDFLLPFKGDGILEIENITDYVEDEYSKVRDGAFSQLITPKERCYPINDRLFKNLQMGLN